MHSPLVASITVFWTIWTATAAPNGGICYNSNHVQDPNSFPCNSEAETSFCCAGNDICLSNGLCEPIGGHDPSNGNGVVGCTDGNYCCYGLDDSSCCSTPSLLFTLGSGPVTAQTTIPASLTNGPSITAASLTPSSAITSLPVSSTSSTISASPFLTPSPSSTATVVTPSPSAPPSNKNVAIGVGVGVGVPATLAVLGALAYLLRRRSNALPTGLESKKEPYVNIDDEGGFEMVGASGTTAQELPEQGLVELQHVASPQTSGFGKH